MKTFNGVQVFSATMQRDRDTLGDRVTSWMRGRPIEVVDVVVTQSSDQEFHCITITLFYFEVQLQPSRRSSDQVPALPRLDAARLPARPSGRVP